MKFRPYANRVLVKLEKEPYEGEMIIPEVNEIKPYRGEVIAYGIGKRSKRGVLLPMTVRKGDRVLFNRYGGTDITISGERYTLIREDEIWGRSIIC